MANYHNGENECPFEVYRPCPACGHGISNYVGGHGSDQVYQCDFCGYKFRAGEEPVEPPKNSNLDPINLLKNLGFLE